MSKPRHDIWRERVAHIPYFTIYIVLLVAVIFVSWIANVYGLKLPDGTLVANLMSVESQRWWLRHAMSHIAQSPFSILLLVLMLISVVRHSGVMAFFRRPIRDGHRPLLSKKLHHAIRVALLFFTLNVIVVLSALFSPHSHLLSITGHLTGSPLAAGWLFLLWITVTLPCLLYGWLGGILRNEQDILHALTAEVARCVSYFPTLIVGSQLIAVLHYLGIPQAYAWSSTTMHILEALVYGLPLLSVFLQRPTEE